MVRDLDPGRSRLVGAGSLIASILGHVVLVGAGTYLFSAFGSRSARGETVAMGEVAVEVAAVDAEHRRARADQGVQGDDGPVRVLGGQPLDEVDLGGDGQGPPVVLECLGMLPKPPVDDAEVGEGVCLARAVARVDRDGHGTPVVFLGVGKPICPFVGKAQVA